MTGVTFITAIFGGIFRVRRIAGLTFILGYRGLKGEEGSFVNCTGRGMQSMNVLRMLLFTPPPEGGEVLSRTVRRGR